jgi:type IV secretory pathway TrbD component
MEITMPVERETIVERSADETVVVGGASSVGIICGIVAAVLAVILLVWLVNGGISSNGDAINVDLPNVTVTE